MIARVVRDWLIVCCLGAILVGLLEVDLHLRRWTVAVDAIMAKSQKAADKVAEAADTSNLVSTQTLDLVGSSTKLVDHTTKVIDNLDATVDNANTVMTQAASSVDQMSTEIGNTMDTLQLQFDRLNTHVITAVDQVGPTLQEGQLTMKGFRDFLSGPLTQNSKDISGVLQPTGLLMTDVQRKTHELFYPAKQGKLVKTLKVVRDLSPFAQPSYYGWRLVEGR